MWENKLNKAANVYNDLWQCVANVCWKIFYLELPTGSNMNGHLTMNLELHTNNDSLPVLQSWRRKYLLEGTRCPAFLTVAKLFGCAGGINSPEKILLIERRLIDFGVTRRTSHLLAWMVSLKELLKRRRSVILSVGSVTCLFWAWIPELFISNDLRLKTIILLGLAGYKMIITNSCSATSLLVYPSLHITRTLVN